MPSAFAGVAHESVSLCSPQARCLVRYASLDSKDPAKRPLRHTDFPSSGVMVFQGSSHAYEYPFCCTTQGYQFSSE